MVSRVHACRRFEAAAVVAQVCTFRKLAEYRLTGAQFRPNHQTAGRALISEVTDGVIEEMKAWQSPPLEPIYPIVYLARCFDGENTPLGL